MTIPAPIFLSAIFLSYLFFSQENDYANPSES